MDKMTIYVGTQPGGCTFELAPRSRRLLNKRRADETPLPRTISIGCDTKQDFVAILGTDKLRQVIAEILTDMPIGELQQLGDVEFLDPSRNLATFDPSAS
ncbi:MAG: hypothetical protein OXU77_03815 [Gammaproteobacteria bacterium]|nr:hypothetical protein [Gammaproteobacteria bacterium]MDE0442546.1 hypothetical protein [Gammaproteobacteria bacterium]